MFKQLRFQNFKSWQDTGDIKLSPITGFFGTNSSGKSAILQFLLMLKQTVESSDRRQVLNTGDEKTYVNLGTFYDIAYNHIIPRTITFSLEWNLSDKLTIFNKEFPKKQVLFQLKKLTFSSEIKLEEYHLFVEHLCYSFFSKHEEVIFKLKRINEGEYKLTSQGYQLNPAYSFISSIPSVSFSEPIKNYSFPDNLSLYLKNDDSRFLYDFVISYEEAFQKIYYLGPLREYPKRIYAWAGGEPQDVGHRGELAIPALLASRKKNVVNQINIEEKVAYWLKKLGLIDSFRVAAIAENRQYYEVRVKRTPNASEVLITDVGFGVSQILPVLVLCYYAPEGSTLILEQPEIHLHPSVQSGLADVFIDVIQTRNLQIILESHSEHLLRRLQRRIAEEKDGLTNEDMSLYFCNLNADGSSKLTALELDQFGNIANWPENFFGDEMGDLFAMTEAAMKRQMGED